MKRIAFNIKNIVDQVKIHIFIHICLFETFASDTGSQKKVRFNINIISSMLFILNTPSEVFLVGLLIGGGS
jgi:hypothetical protein